WVANAADIAELGQRLNQRLILAGGGFAKISSAGVVRIASMLDDTVWQPSRLDYAAGASCGEGLEQRRAARIWDDAAAPLTRDDVPKLSADEVQRYTEIEARLRAEAQPESARKRSAWMEQRKRDDLSTSVTWSSSGTVEYLDGEHEVRLESGDWVT